MAAMATTVATHILNMMNIVSLVVAALVETAVVVLVPASELVAVLVELALVVQTRTVVKKKV